MTTKFEFLSYSGVIKTFVCSHEMKLMTPYHYMLGYCLQEKLNADDTPLVDRRGATMARDIVQFVPFNKIKEQGISLVGITNL